MSKTADMNCAKRRDRAQIADIESRMEVVRSTGAAELRQLGSEHALRLRPLRDVAIDQTRVRCAR